MNSGSPMNLPLYTAAQTRALDALAVASGAASGYELMCRAGADALAAIQARWPQVKRLLVLCGTGNNGGDGWVVARLAAQAGLSVQVVLAGDVNRIAGEARQALDDFQQAGLGFERWTPGQVLSLDKSLGEGTNEGEGGIDVLVDALLGTGLSNTLRPDMVNLIEFVNSSGLQVFSIDCPSGLLPDTGVPAPVVVQAATTPSVIGRNRGLFTGQAVDFTGDVKFSDLGMSQCSPEFIDASAGFDSALLSLEVLLTQLPKLSRNAHKNQQGHVVVIGGADGTAGAAVLSAEAALRAGAGLVSLAAQPSAVAAALSRCPEVMARAVANRSELRSQLEAATVLVVGPGLGSDRWSHELLGAALDAKVPMVLDADGLNGLVGMRALDLLPSTVLTPHPGEAARLLGITTADVAKDRFAALEALVDRYRCHVLLKGAGTLVGGPGADPVGVCPYGNPGMASGGMGDALAGIIGALMAQGMSPDLAVRLGACLHGRAGDIAAVELGERSLLAGDLIDRLPAALP